MHFLCRVQVRSRTCAPGAGGGAAVAGMRHLSPSLAWQALSGEQLQVDFSKTDALLLELKVSLSFVSIVAVGVVHTCQNPLLELTITS